MKVLLVDDEQPALDELMFLLKQLSTTYNLEDIVGLNNPKKALEYILLNDVDVVFLDISMPEMDGFVLAEALLRLRKKPVIIFATAYDAYAIKAFEVNAVDYLLKPIELERLELTVQRITKRLHSLEEEEHHRSGLSALIKERYVDKKATRIPLWKNDRMHLLNPLDILYCMSIDGDTTVHTTRGTFITTDPLGHFEDILKGYDFFRCHRSYLIQLDSVLEVIPWFNNGYMVKMSSSDEEIPISRRKLKDFKKYFEL